MTNFEKYKEDILKIVNENCCSPAKKDGVIVACAGLDCKKCDFGDASKCRKNFLNWLYKDDEEHDGCDWFYKDDEEHDGCDGCKYEDKREDESPCTECCNNYTSKWERRPKKTRQDEFLERYPNAKTCNKVIEICPKALDVRFNCEIQNLTRTCSRCCRDYWLQEVE